MKVIAEEKFNCFQLSPSARAWVALGVFDGLHLGHLAVVSECRESAERIDGSPCVLTFSSHPVTILGKQEKQRALFTLEERVARFASQGMQYVLLPDFTLEFARQTPEEFIEEILIGRLNISGVVTGFNYRFGRKRSGNIETLRQIGKKLGFETRAVRPIDFNGQPISSTRIREELRTGNLQSANSMLGTPFSLVGTVVTGESKGRQLGFPTANLKLLRPAFLPDGVYAAEAWVLESPSEFPDSPGLHGMLYLGHRPTFKSSASARSAELHLLDYSGDLYDAVIRVRPLAQLRGDQRFNSEAELSEQISRDIEEAREIARRV